MKDWKQVLVSPTTSILETMKIIDDQALQIALVVGGHGELLGLVTDGDIRRGILKGTPLDFPVSEVMNAEPTVFRSTESRNHINRIIKQKQLRHVPVVDRDNILIDLMVTDDLISDQSKDNWVVLMAGGLGTRLRPLTDEVPKPLLKVGGKPILETIIEGFIAYGFNKFYLSVNYRKEMIKAYFGDGSAWGVTIRYLDEDKQLGTAGALSLLEEKIQEPLIVMNGDLITKVNFSKLLDFHIEQHSQATMCVREYEFQVPYGVIRTKQQQLVSIEEKPIERYFVNAGIYVLEPEVLPFIPQDSFYTMPELFTELIGKGKSTTVFPIREYWMDIGRMDDFEKAMIYFAENAQKS